MFLLPLTENRCLNSLTRSHHHAVTADALCFSSSLWKCCNIFSLFWCFIGTCVFLFLCNDWLCTYYIYQYYYLFFVRLTTEEFSRILKEGLYTCILTSSQARFQFGPIIHLPWKGTVHLYIKPMSVGISDPTYM